MVPLPPWHVVTISNIRFAESAGARWPLQIAASMATLALRAPQIFGNTAGIKEPNRPQLSWGFLIFWDNDTVTVCHVHIGENWQGLMNVNRSMWSEIVETTLLTQVRHSFFFHGRFIPSTTHWWWSCLIRLGLSYPYSRLPIISHHEESLVGWPSPCHLESTSYTSPLRLCIHDDADRRPSFLEDSGVSRCFREKGHWWKWWSKGMHWCTLFSIVPVVSLGLPGDWHAPWPDCKFERLSNTGRIPVVRWSMWHFLDHH